MRNEEKEKLKEGISSLYLHGTDYLKLDDVLKTINALPESEGWVDCKTRLPENECIAIGYQDEILIGYISDDDELSGRFICTNDHETLTHVTHWRELPAPPSTVTGKEKGK